jgi:hypothetical protein
VRYSSLLIKISQRVIGTSFALSVRALTPVKNKNWRCS